MAGTTHTTSAITRNGFIFTNGQFCVDVDGHLHKREDAATLYVLLTFVPPPAPLTKDRKVPRKAANIDREAHFYTAQLLHYGLPSLKTREPAKKKLLAAFGGANGKTLEIPKHILDLEVELGKEWRDADTKLAKKEAAKEKKRKAEVADLSDKVAESSKKAKSTVPKPKTKAQIRKEIAVLPEDIARKLLAKLLADVPAVEDILAMELSTLSTKIPATSTKTANTSSKAAGSAIKVEAGGATVNFIKDSNTVAKTGAGSKSAPYRYFLNPAIPTWTGLYDIRAPRLASNWSQQASGPMSLEVYPSSTSAHIWASFNFGILSGIMRSRNTVPSRFNTDIAFEWRGREAGEEVMTFADCNKGVLRFADDGSISATMDSDLCGEFTFSGELQMRGGKAVPRKNGVQQRQAVTDWKSQFRSINWRNFDIDNHVRWGGWNGLHPKEDKAFESDTSLGHKQHDENSEEEEWGDSDDDEYEAYYLFGGF